MFLRVVPALASRAEFSKCGPQVRSITWELARNVNFPAPPRGADSGTHGGYLDQVCQGLQVTDAFPAWRTVLCADYSKRSQSWLHIGVTGEGGFYTCACWARQGRGDSEVGPMQEPPRPLCAARAGGTWVVIVRSSSAGVTQFGLSPWLCPLSAQWNLVGGLRPQCPYLHNEDKNAHPLGLS